jgi:acetylserotonin N-methyltransferase
MSIPSAADHRGAVVDDRPLWDLWLSSFSLPVVCVSIELGIFEALAEQPGGPHALAARLQLEPRGVAAVLELLAAQRLVHRGSADGASTLAADYELTELGRACVTADSSTSWCSLFEVFATPLGNPTLRERLREMLRHTHRVVAHPENESPTKARDGNPALPAEEWARGSIAADRVRRIARVMHAHSVAAAHAVASKPEFDSVSHLLDVGGGSGCYSIALALARPRLRCTVMELPSMCPIVEEYCAAAGVTARVDTNALDMFRDPWPAGYDGIFFSNVFHDWTEETNRALASKAFAALPSGGRIFLHELLLDRTSKTAHVAASFSLLMVLNTFGRQYTFDELRTLLKRCGFIDVSVTPTASYYSLLVARKP